MLNIFTGTPQHWHLRLGVIFSGFWRSNGVIEWIKGFHFFDLVFRLSIRNRLLNVSPTHTGILSKKPAIPPKFFICWNWVNKSSKSNAPPFWIFFAIFRLFRGRFCFQLLQPMTVHHPYPRYVPDACSGGMVLRHQVTPRPKNFSGLPVIARTDKAAPPRASPSIWSKSHRSKAMRH